MSHQLRLFPSQVAAPTGHRGRFLTELRGMMAALEQAPTLATQLQACATAVSKLRSGQEHGTHYEKALVPLLLEHWDAIRTETLDALDDTSRARVDDITLQKGPGPRAMADMIVTWHLTDGTWKVPVNVKAEAPSTDGGSSNGCAVSSFIRMATEDSWTPTEKSPPKGWPVSRSLVEWVGKRRKIRTGRDYYLLVVEVTSTSTVTRHALVGLLASVNGDSRPLVQRHSNREVVKVGNTVTVQPLADDFDVNLAIARALLPSGNPDELRLHLLAFLAAGAGDRRTVTLAQTLLDLDDDELRRRIREAVLPRE